MIARRLPVLGQSGAMAEAIDRFDWSASMLGPMPLWSRSLQHSVNTMLASRFPMFLVWGPHRIFLHNEAYLPVLGHKRASALGKPIKELWSEVIEQIGPIIDDAFENRGSFYEDLPIVLHRNGFDEQTYFTFSYSPVIDDDYSIGGALCVCVETTAAVMAKQRQTDENERLRLLLNQSPGFAASLIGPDLVFEMHNAAYSELVGARDLIGRPFAQAVPEASEQGFVPMLQDVLTSGRPFIGAEVRYESGRSGPGAREEVFVNCVFQPMTDAEGKVFGVFVQGHDVTEQVNARKALLAADRHKDQFIATLSHELRNPLAPIRAASHLLAAAHVAPDTTERAAKIIARQVGHMSRLLDDLLDVARISRNQMRLQLETCRVEDLVRSAVETARPSIEAKGHHLALYLSEEAILADVDPVRISQVISNLLTNATKYTRPNGCIALVSSMQGGQWRLEVIDSGIGLSPDAIERVFDMFAQERDALEHAEGGLGIGLGLAKGIIEAHGGAISATSGGPGLGSAFSFTLPARAGDIALAESAPRAAAASVEGLRVLVVDDNADLVDIARTTLEMEGCLVCQASDGEAALAEYRRQRPAVAVLDIGMPLLNGYEVARAIRQEPDGKGVFLIAATGWGSPADEAMARSAGFDAHLTKPFDMARLLSLISVAAASSPN